jgi:Acyl-CoA dehydrogenase, C-terminal domain
MVQVLGGYGYTRDFLVERYMREAKVTQIFEGTNQIQWMVIARGVPQGLKQGARLVSLAPAVPLPRQRGMLRQNRLIAVLGLVLAAAALGGFFLLQSSTAGPAAAGDRAQVTGYATSNFFTETGAVSFEVRGASAARIEQIVDRLPKANPEYICAENWEAYEITFTAGAGSNQGFHLVAYACGNLVVKVPARGLTEDLIDRNCALLAAARQVIPASATETHAIVCGPASGQLIAGTSR